MAHSSKKYNKKVMLVTGGGRGIGASIAQKAAAEGYAVVVNFCRNPQSANKLVHEIKERGGVAFSFQADVALEEDVVSLFSFIRDKFSRLDCLINNAGIIEKKAQVAEMSYQRLQKNFTTNVIAPFICAREAIPLMIDGGSIINVSSIAARLGSAFEFVDYASAKGAIDTFTVGLSKELAAKNIRVNAVRPGLIKTEIHASCGESERVKRLEDTIPMKRGGEAGEVADAVLWLCSDNASYITGSILDVAGGR